VRTADHATPAAKVRRGPARRAAVHRLERREILGVAVEPEERVGQSLDELLDPRRRHHLAAVLGILVEEDVHATLRGHARG
jgi:N-acyl-D-aspartate/D-glutamate deacylase